MHRKRTYTHENREPATTRWVRFGEAHPATHENGGAASAVGIGIGVAVAIAVGACGKASLDRLSHNH